MILDMEHLNMEKMILMPHLRAIGLPNEIAPDIVLIHTMKKAKGKTLILPIVQLKKDLKCGDEMYLAWS